MKKNTFLASPKNYINGLKPPLRGLLPSLPIFPQKNRERWEWGCRVLSDRRPIQDLRLWCRNDLHPHSRLNKYFWRKIYLAWSGPLKWGLSPSRKVALLFAVFPIICGLGFLSKSFAQSPSALFQIALENNPSLKALDATYQASLTKGDQVSQLANPELSMGGFIFPIETRLGPQQARIGLSQQFPWPGTFKAKTQQAAKIAEAQFLEIAKQQLELKYALSMHWLQLYELHHRKGILQKHERLLASLKTLSQSKVETGQGLLAEVLLVELEIEALKKELELLDLGKRNPQIALNRILNQDLNTKIEIADSLHFAQFSWGKDTLLNLVAQHPALQQLAMQQAVSQETIKTNKLEGRPTFGIGAEYGWIRPRDDAFPLQNGRDMLLVKASVSIPIYRKKYIAKEQEEQLKVKSLEHQHKDQQLQLAYTIESAYVRQAEAKVRYDLYDTQINNTRAAIQLLEGAYSANNSKFEELLRLRRKLIDYEVEMLKAVVESHMAKVEVERLITLEF